MVNALADVCAVIAVLCGGTLMAMACWSLWRPRFVFWPPPRDGGWQKPVFMGLFRGLVYGLVLASGVTLWRAGIEVGAIWIALAILLWGCGFGMALTATGGLGWRRAFGEDKGLKTDGIFRYSRHPIYVATWFGLAGWAILVPSPLVLASLATWAGLYAIAMPLEERALTARYGAPYTDYAAGVSRYLQVRAG